MSSFPKDFLWGAATSAHQVEGNNKENDWWAWEKEAGLEEPSGEACRHYQLYKQDFDLAVSLGHNAHRFSLEWSRLEPEKNAFSQREIDHYTDVIFSLKERNLKPLVTLHHFTNPQWFSRIGGWQSPGASRYFLRYVEKALEAWAGDIDLWITINEPLIYAYFSYFAGDWPPGKKSWLAAAQVLHNLSVAHIKAYRLIHYVYKKRRLPPPRVSIAQNMQAFVSCNNSLKNRLALYLRDKGFNFIFLDKLARNRSLDFIGVNYYSRNLIDLQSWGLPSLLFATCSRHNTLKKNYLGWEIYPEGLYQLLIKLKKYNLPVLISENGICTEEDTLRWEYIRSHLEAVHRAMDEGSHVLGYFYWSLLDNFEWDKGFGARFGLVGIDYKTYQRNIRESARKFAVVCSTNMLE